MSPIASLSLFVLLRLLPARPLAMAHSLLQLLLSSAIAMHGLCGMCAAYYLDDSAVVAQDFMGVQNQARAQVGEAPLRWSTQLANYARWWAAQNAATGDCQLHHSGGPYGENIFWGSGRDWTPYDAASDWASEKRWYNYWSNSCLFYDACGHYTQIVWRDTQYVGCARVTCNDGDIFMTCNYYPPGNYIGERPY